MAKFKQVNIIIVSRGKNIMSELSRFTLVILGCVSEAFECKSATLQEGGHTSAIGGVTRSQGTHLLEQGGAGQGTQFAVTAPASAPITATLRLGHHVPVTGGHLAQIGQDFSEAEAVSVICRGRQRDKLTHYTQEGTRELVFRRAAGSALSAGQQDNPR